MNTVYAHSSESIANKHTSASVLNLMIYILFACASFFIFFLLLRVKEERLSLRIIDSIWFDRIELNSNRSNKSAHRTQQLAKEKKTRKIHSRDKNEKKILLFMFNFKYFSTCAMFFSFSFHFLCLWFHWILHCCWRFGFYSTKFHGKLKCHTNSLRINFVFNRLKRLLICF